MRTDSPWHGCRFLALLACGLALTAAAAYAQGTCPTSTLDCGDGPIQSTLPQHEIVCGPYASGRASYDLVNGLLTANAAGDDPGGLGRVEAVDEYHVIGVPDGTPLTFQAELLVSGTVTLGCGYSPGGSVGATLREGASNSASATASAVPESCDELGVCCGGSAALDRTLSVTLATAAGQAFRVTSILGATARFGSASVSARLRFAGLPPGAAVVSCQGFRQDFPTPVRPLTWGALRVRYR